MSMHFSLPKSNLFRIIEFVYLTNYLVLIENNTRCFCVEKEVNKGVQAVSNLVWRHWYGVYWVPKGKYGTILRCYALRVTETTNTRFLRLWMGASVNTSLYMMHKNWLSGPLLWRWMWHLCIYIESRNRSDYPNPLLLIINTKSILCRDGKCGSYKYQTCNRDRVVERAKQSWTVGFSSLVQIFFYNNEPSRRLPGVPYALGLACICLEYYELIMSRDWTILFISLPKNSEKSA